MKTGLLIAAVLATLVIVAGLFITHAVESEAAVCLSAAQEICALADMREWARAGEACRAYEAQWKTSLAWLTFVLPESVTDRISEAFAALGTYIRTEDHTMTLLTAGDLRIACEEMLEGERLTLQSLL